TISWTVTNHGASDAGADDWIDQIYLSMDGTYDWNDTFITSRQHVGGLGAGESYTASVTVNLPHAQGGYIIVYTDANGQQPESDNENNSASAAMDVSFAPGDLAIIDTESPSTAAAGEWVDLQFTVSNLQAGTFAVGDWTDSVYLSDDDVLDDGDTRLMNFYPSVTELGEGESYTNSSSVQLPHRTGAYLIFVVDEYGAQPETDETNNTLAVPLTVSYTPPDLVVSAATVIPTSLTPDQNGNYPVEVAWTVRNDGEGTAHPFQYSYWTDSVYLSMDDVFDPDDRQITNSYRYSSLAPGETYDYSWSGTINRAYLGNYILFVTDRQDNVEESDETNNTRAVSISMPSPDLVVTSASVEPDTAGHSTRTVNVTYRVENQGDIAAMPSYSYWYDAFYLSDDDLWDENDLFASYRYVSSPDIPLDVGEHYEITTSVNIPSEAAPGAKYLLVVADGYYSRVAELDRTNNVYAIPLNVGAGDLSVVPESVSWQVTPVTVGNWSHSTAGTEPAYDFTFTAGEEVRVSSIQTRHSGSPSQISISILDSDGALIGSWAGTSGSSNAWVVEMDMVLQPGDYRVSASAPSSWYRSAVTGEGIAQVTYTPTRTNVAVMGSEITVNWTTENTGDLSYENYIYEAVYLSLDAVWNPSEDVSVGSFYFSYSESNPFSPGATGVRNGTIRIPAGAALGDMYLLVVTDSYRQFLETDETNNVQAIPISVVAPDLVVTEATAPPSAAWSEPIPVSWTVTNQGQYPAYVNYWYDYLFLSVDDVYDGSDAQIDYFDVRDQLPLAPGESYTFSTTVKVNPSSEGPHHLIFYADRYDYQGETDTGNNYLARGITILQAPDLVVTDFDAPDAGSSGGIVEVSWTVLNQGDGPAAAIWPDQILLSRDKGWDYNDTGVFRQDHLGFLLSEGQSALLFYGSYGRVETSLNLDQSSSGPGVTLEAWVLPVSSAGSTYRHVISTSSTSAGKEWSIVQRGDTWHLANGIEIVDTGLSVDVGAWQHVAAVFEPGVGITFYKNGTETFTTSEIGYSLNDRNVMIGSNPAYTYYSFVGYMDEVRVWNGVRSQVQIEEAGDLNLEGTEAGLAGYWKFDDGGGLTAADSASGDYPGTLVGGYSSKNPESAPAWVSSPGPDSYSVTRMIRLPSNISLPNPETGTNEYHLLVYTDYQYYGGQGSQRESNETNNYPSSANDYVGSCPITIENADLKILTAPTVPPTASAGQRIEVSWEVTNDHIGTANASYWYDYIYLSDDNVFDTGDRSLGYSYIDNSAGLAGGASYTRTLNITIPTDAVGVKYLIFYVDRWNSQAEVDVTNNTYAVAVTLNAPDLEVTSVNAPDSAVLGESIPVSWTVTNTGEHATTTYWYDRVYVSSDQSLGEDDTLIGEFYAGPSTSQPLGPGESYTLTKDIFLPETVTGSVYIIIFTDGSGRQGETDETNNTSYRAITLDAPDLTIYEGDVTAPGSLVLGEVVPVSWTVTNRGSVAAAADWYDRVYFSMDTVLDPSDLLLGSFSAATYTPLGAGESYTRTVDVKVPSVWASQAGYLIVKADGTNLQGETDETNNTRATSVVVTAPDLAAGRITAPSSAVSSQLIDVSWRVDNVGNSPALSAWRDAIYLSSDQVLSDDDTRLQVFSAADRVPLEPGSFYTTITSLRLPAISAGTYYLIIKVDEYDEQGESDEANNTAVSGPLAAKVPDLTVTGVSAPEASSPNATVTLSWTVKNLSTDVPAPGVWYDYVYLSADSSLNESNDIFVTSVLRDSNTALGPGTSYTVTRDVTLPKVAQGTWYVLVKTDGTNSQGESDETNNVGVSAAVTIEIPDLTVTSIHAPDQAAVQQTIPLTWQVTNIGPGSASGTWRDYVYLSTNSTWENDDLLIATFDMVGVSPLAAGASYTVTKNVTLPKGADAYSYLIVYTDGGDAQGEADETNNASTGAGIAIQEPPDLEIPAVSAPSTAAVGQLIDIAWTVTNTGASTAYADWYDRVYLNDSDTLDGSETLLVNERISAQTPLAPDSSYSGSRQVRLPSEGTGTRYLIFVANADGAQGETDFSNNTVVRALEISDPDLTITSTTFPAAANWGERVTVSWTVTNEGSGAAAATWYDRLYLSADPTLDIDDTLVISLNQGAQSPLAPGASYIVTREVTLPPALTGAGYFIVVTDATGAQSESDESNNQVAVQFDFNAADLEITDVTLPASAAWGERIALDWTVANTGTGTAVAAWWDMVFLSTDAVYDSNDLLLTSAYRTANTPLAPGESYTVNKPSTAVTAIPQSVGTGTFHL
ncbi:MAG TPA: hypothetical protein ENN79_00390, partial [Desulfobacteraceae bacterium]|nr:hypothetical protein [Desulfobacteraceae bacterium]